MSHRQLALHMHNFAPSVEKFNEIDSLRDGMLLVQKDHHNGQDYVVAVEHKKYSIFGILYHPEYQPLYFLNFNRQLTDEIGFRISLKINRIARTNSQRWTLGDQVFERWRIDRVKIKASKFVLFDKYEYRNHQDIDEHFQQY